MNIVNLYVWKKVWSCTWCHRKVNVLDVPPTTLQSKTFNLLLADLNYTSYHPVIAIVCVYNTLCIRNCDVYHSYDFYEYFFFVWIHISAKPKHIFFFSFSFIMTQSALQIWLMCATTNNRYYNVCAIQSQSQKKICIMICVTILLIVVASVIAGYFGFNPTSSSD